MFLNLLAAQTPMVKLLHAYNLVCLCFCFTTSLQRVFEIYECIIFSLYKKRCFNFKMALKITVQDQKSF
jgi:hypothetical protein